MRAARFRRTMTSCSAASTSQARGGCSSSQRRRHRYRLGGAAGLAVVEAAVDLARPWPLTFAVDNTLGTTRSRRSAIADLTSQLLIVAVGALLVPR